MASRFWVGGTGTWDAVTTTNWAASSGGAGGQSVPTTSDTVTFDSNSGASATVTISTATAQASAVTINKSDITVTHVLVGSNVTGAVTLTTGTLNTSNQTCTWGSLASTGSATRTLTLGSSAITLTGNWQLNFTGLTMTANTATLTQSGAAAGFDNAASCGGNYNGTSLTQSGSGISVLGISTGSAGTLGTYTRTGTAVKTDGVNVGKNQTLTTLAVNGNSLTNRLIMAGTTRGTAATITVTNAPTLTNTDFMDITAAGGGGTWSGTSLGNSGGNTSITFTVGAGTTNAYGGVNRYGVVAGNTSATATWSTTSGGAGGASVPLPQDSVFFNASSAAGTYTNDMPRFATDIDCTGFARTFATGGTNWETYGSILWVSTMTITNNPLLTLAGRGSHTFTSNTKVTVPGLSQFGPGGTYTQADAITCSQTTGISWTAGTWNDGGFGGTLSSTANSALVNGGTVTLTGTWNFSRTSTGAYWSFTGGSLTASSATFVLTATSANTRTFAGGGGSYGTLTYTVAGSTGQLNITGANTFGTINFSDVTNARTLAFTAATTTTITTLFNVNGTSTKLMTVTSVTAATHTLSKTSGTVSCDFLSVDHSIATGGAGWYAGANSTDGGSNTGWIFTAPPVTVPGGNMLLMGVG